jgi:trehalose 6-phosphate synthase
MRNACSPDAAGKGTAGGLAVALREAFQAYEGLWFGWSGKVSQLRSH